MNRCLALGLIAAAAPGALLPARALGAPQEEPPREAQEAADDRRGEAIARYRKGRALYGEGAWAAALAEFLASRRLHPMWVATSSAALCLKQLGRYDEALDLFEALLREFGAEMPVGARDVAQREVVALRGRVGTIEIEGAEPGAGISIDGQSRGEFPAPGPLRVVAGSHLVRLTKEGFEPFERRVEVAGGQTARVVVRLRALARSGRLRVAEQGGKALDVVVDGSVVGKTPCKGKTIRRRRNNPEWFRNVGCCARQLRRQARGGRASCTWPWARAGAGAGGRGSSRARLRIAAPGARARGCGCSPSSRSTRRNSARPPSSIRRRSRSARCLAAAWASGRATAPRLADVEVAARELGAAVVHVGTLGAVADVESDVVHLG